MPSKTREDIFLEKLSDLLRDNRAQATTEPHAGTPRSGRDGQSGDGGQPDAGHRSDGRGARTGSQRERSRNAES